MTETATQQEKPRLRTVQETAAELGLSKRKVELLISSGDLESVQIPGPNGPWGRRVEQTEIDAFIARNRGATTP